MNLDAPLILVSGLASGALSAAFGVGGAIISTPAIRALGVSASLAVGTTLPSILPGAVVGSLRYTRERLVDWRAAAMTAPAGMVTAVLGALLSRAVPGHGHWLMLLTAGLLGLSAVRIRRGAPQRAVGGTAPMAGPARLNPLVLGALGGVAGLLSGVLGVGGGLILVAGFTQLSDLPMRTAIGTSLLCVGLQAVPGTLAHGVLRGIDWHVALLLTIGTVPGAAIGSGLAMRSSDHRLRQAIAAVLGFVAVVYAAREGIALI